MSILSLSSAEKINQTTGKNTVEISDEELHKKDKDAEAFRATLNEEKEQQSTLQDSEAEALKKELLEAGITVKIDYRKYKNTSDVYGIMSKINSIKDLESGVNVNWMEAKNKKSELLSLGMDVGFYNNMNSYVVSQIDSDDKYSCGYHNCTGIVVFGIDKKTGKRISMLSHQNPTCFLQDTGELFKSLNTKLNIFKESCQNKTISTYIVGGNVGSEEKDKIYQDSITQLTDFIKSSTHQNPIILTPNSNKGDVAIKVNTQNNEIIILQPNQ